MREARVGEVEASRGDAVKSLLMIASAGVIVGGMSERDLTTVEGLQQACHELGPPESWEDSRREWVHALAETIQWVLSADEGARGTYEFQHRLWENNRVAATGQGKVSVDRALRDEKFRSWLAKRSMEALPSGRVERLKVLSRLYDDLKRELDPFVNRAIPHLKIFRVIAALYPEAMTTIAGKSHMRALCRALGAERGLDPVERHLWARERLDTALGPTELPPIALATRMALPWMLYKQFVLRPDEAPAESDGSSPDGAALTPLPAARRRRGLTPVRGYFQGMLSTLEFVRDGVTRQELFDFLHASAPELKDASIGITINALQSEFGAMRREADRYVLTERGMNVLESQDPSDLADWLLTRILGVDHAVVALRDRGHLGTPEFMELIRAVNPNWTTDFVPRAMIGWLRSMGVIEADGSTQGLTERGREWASLIDWVPEALPREEETVIDVDIPVRPRPAEISLRPFDEIVAAIQAEGHFPAELITRLHAGLWAHERRHFAVFTGLSGSGKTLLARAYAKAISPDASGRNAFTLPIQPGWYDPSALLGYVNPLRGESYVRTAFLEFLIAAVNDPGRPYVAVLDEMNLSHPEQYMAPLLSAMETGDSIQLHNEGAFFDGIPASVAYPSNLALIGTVNMDETTHGLSDKVLDRAFVLDFWDVDLASYPRWGSRAAVAPHEALIRTVLGELIEALRPARLHFGWRVVDDVLDFLSRVATATGALQIGASLDGVIYAKILPKLRGEDAPRIRDAFVQCERVLANHNLEASRAKVAELRRDLETTGSARFWR